MTGATGLIGQELGAELVRRGHEISVLARNPEQAAKKVSFTQNLHQWHGERLAEDWLRGVEAVIHLAGEPIANSRWTEAVKKRIYDSRVLSSKNIVESILAADAKITAQLHTVIAASAIGIYGDTGSQVVDETKEPAVEDFLAQVCQDWEAAFLPLSHSPGSPPKCRVVHLRTGVVLSKAGGALEKMLPVFRMGMGGKLGSGDQWMSWIHIQDLVQMICFSLENSKVVGPINAVAPNPVTNAEFTKILAETLGRPAIVPVPAMALKLALGEMSGVLLGGSRVSAEKIQKLGFQFEFSKLPDALKACVG